MERVIRLSGNSRVIGELMIRLILSLFSAFGIIAVVLKVIDVTYSDSNNTLVNILYFAVVMLIMLITVDKEKLA